MMLGWLFMLEILKSLFKGLRDLFDWRGDDRFLFVRDQKFGAPFASGISSTSDTPKQHGVRAERLLEGGAVLGANDGHDTSLALGEERRLRARPGAWKLCDVDGAAE